MRIQREKPINNEVMKHIQQLEQSQNCTEIARITTSVSKQHETFEYI